MGRKRQHSPWWSKEAAPLTDVNQRAEERDFPAAQDTAQSPSPQPQNKKVVLPQNCLPWVRLSTALSTVIIRRHTHQRSLSLLPPTHSPCCHHSPPHAPGSMRRVRILCWCHLQRQGKTVSIRQGGGSAAKNCLPVTSTIAHSPYHHFPPSLCRSHILHGWLREEDIGASVSIRQGGEVATPGQNCQFLARGGEGGVLQKIVCLSYPPLLTLRATSPPFLSISHPTRQAQCGGYWSFCWCCLQRLGKTVSI